MGSGELPPKTTVGLEWGGPSKVLLLSGVHWRTGSQEAQAPGEVGPVSSKWLRDLKAGSAGQLTDRTSGRRVLAEPRK